MSYTRWSNSDWYIWSEQDVHNHVEILAIWHVKDQDIDPQKFYKQEIRKLLKHRNFSSVRHFDESIVKHLESFLEKTK